MRSQSLPDSTLARPLTFSSGTTTNATPRSDAGTSAGDATESPPSASRCCSSRRHVSEVMSSRPCSP